MRFWDSSAVIPLLVRQAASPRADQWLAQDSQTVLWALTPVEITSALWRLVREEALSERDAQAAELRAQQLTDASEVVADLDSVKAVAQRILRVHPLRAADALQLAAGLIWAGSRPQGKIFHTLDERLAASARREGFEVP